MGWKVKLGSRLRLTTWAVLLTLPICAEGAFELESSGPRAISLGNGGVALRGDAWALLRNPALADGSDFRAGTSWTQQFGLPELSRESIAAGGTMQSHSFGIRAINFGSDLYREGEFGLILAHSLRDRLSLGIEVSGKWLQVRNYSSGTALSLSAGIAVQPAERVEVGAVWRNANESRLSGYSDRLGSALQVGVAAAIWESSVIVADIVQEKHFPAEYRAGVEARLLPSLRLRVGARAEPVRPSAGFQVDIGRWIFSYAGDLHPDLGASHEVGLEVQLYR